MNRLSSEHQAQIAAALAEGGSIRGTARQLGFTQNTVMRNLRWIGAACRAYHDKYVRNLKCTLVECDELWNFIYAKDVNLPDELKNNPNFGDTWTFCAICSHTKLVISWHVGKRVPSDTQIFADDLESRIPGHLQVNSDQLALYRPAFENAFGDRADYATLSKKMTGPNSSPDGKYEQPDLKAERKRSVMGSPDMTKVFTHSIERQNLTLRQWNRRYTRASLGFSRCIENLEASLALHYMRYNFCHQHDSLGGSTPAIEAGVTDHIWEIEDVAALVPPLLSKPRGKYKKRYGRDRILPE